MSDPLIKKIDVVSGNEYLEGQTVGSLGRKRSTHQIQTTKEEENPWRQAQEVDDGKLARLLQNRPLRREWTERSSERVERVLGGARIDEVPL